MSTNVGDDSKRDLKVGHQFTQTMEVLVEAEVTVEAVFENGAVLSIDADTVTLAHGPLQVAHDRGEQYWPQHLDSNVRARLRTLRWTSWLGRAHWPAKQSSS